MDVQLLSAAGGEFAGGAHVVFHVAGAEHAARVDIFKAGKNLCRVAAHDVEHDIEPSAMAHAHEGLHGPAGGGNLEDFIEQRDQPAQTFEREALGPQVARLDDLLKQLRADEPLENALRAGSGGECGGGLFHALLDPKAALGLGQVHEFGANGTAIDGAGLVSRLARELKLGVRLRRQEAQGIEGCLKVSPAAEEVEDFFPVGGLLPGGSQHGFSSAHDFLASNCALAILGVELGLSLWI